MKDSERLKGDYRKLDGLIDLRGTAEISAMRGFVLAELKEAVIREGGSWYACLAELGINERTARRRMMVAKIWLRTSLVVRRRKMSENAFLLLHRRAKRAAKRAQQAEHLADALKRADKLPPDKAYRVEHVDCRKYPWPMVDVIATDPPWADTDAYLWLAGFAADKLRPGGLCLVQCGAGDVLAAGGLLADAGLAYLWTLAMIYPDVRGQRPLPPFSPCWRPVLVLCRGEFNRSRFPTASDTYTVPPSEKSWHPWGQPMPPWSYWLSRWTLPGELVADPFAGAGRIGRALKRVGGRRYLGTEVDPKYARAARGDLLAEKEGTYRPDGDKA